jgi:hypothetical protein
LTDRELEGRLRAWYRAEVGEDVIAPVSLRRDVAAIPRTESRPAGRFDRRRDVMLFAAAALVLVGGAAAVGSGLLRLPSLVPPEPVPSVAIVPTPSPAAESPSPLISPPTVRASSWTVTGPMIEAREGGTATLLLDGKVLVAGGFGKQDGPGGVMSLLASAELYDRAAGRGPPLGAWSRIAETRRRRCCQTAECS